MEKLKKDGEYWRIDLCITPYTKQQVNDIMSGLGWILVETWSTPGHFKKMMQAPPMFLRYEKELGEKPAYVEAVDLDGWEDPCMHQVMSITMPHDVLNSFLVGGFSQKKHRGLTMLYKEIE